MKLTIKTRSTTWHLQISQQTLLANFFIFNPNNFENKSNLKKKLKSPAPQMFAKTHRVR